MQQLPQDPYREAPPRGRDLPIDAAEHQEELRELALTRGQYNADAYVFFGALFQVALLGGLPALAAATVVGMFDEDAVTPVALTVLAVVGLPGAFFTYRGRWARVEAFSSRFCSGLANLSMLYVPFIAFVYANVLVVKDLTRRR